MFFFLSTFINTQNMICILSLNVYKFKLLEKSIILTCYKDLKDLYIYLFLSGSFLPIRLDSNGKEVRWTYGRIRIEFL